MQVTYTALLRHHLRPRDPERHSILLTRCVQDREWRPAYKALDARFAESYSYSYCSSYWCLLLQLIIMTIISITTTIFTTNISIPGKTAFEQNLGLHPEAHTLQWATWPGPHSSVSIGLYAV